MTLRFSEPEFLALDDKRHRARTSFQAIGYALFMGWLAEEKTPEIFHPGNLPNTASPTVGIVSGVTVEETEDEPLRVELGEALDRIIRSGHETAILAIAHNLRAFDVLVAVDSEGKRERIHLPSWTEITRPLADFRFFGKKDAERKSEHKPGNNKAAG